MSDNIVMTGGPWFINPDNLDTRLLFVDNLKNAMEVVGGVTPAKEWYCELQDKEVKWAELFWPLYCPVCGAAVHEQLSSHHWFKEAR